MIMLMWHVVACCSTSSSAQLPLAQLHVGQICASPRLLYMCSLLYTSTCAPGHRSQGFPLPEHFDPSAITSYPSTIMSYPSTIRPPYTLPKSASMCAGAGVAAGQLAVPSPGGRRRLRRHGTCTVRRLLFPVVQGRPTTCTRGWDCIGASHTCVPLGSLRRPAC